MESGVVDIEKNPAMNGKRGVYLLVAGLTSLLVSWSYTIGETKARRAAFEAMPLLSPRVLGACLLVASILAVCAALVSGRSRLAESFGWGAAFFTPAALTVVWGYIAFLETPLRSTLGFAAALIVLLLTVGLALLSKGTPLWVTWAVFLTGAALAFSVTLLVAPDSSWTPWASSSVYIGWICMIAIAADWDNPTFLLKE